MVSFRLIYYRWIRSYSAFFLVGLLILLSQILLAFKFFTLNNDIPQDVWNPHKVTQMEAQTRLQLKDFNAPCEIKTKEAVSAINRAKTLKCKQEISNITCLIYNGLLYPKFLPNYCTDERFEMGRSLGCFQDKKHIRLLGGLYTNNKNSNSPDSCIKLCLQSGFVYAGVQYSTECFCGNEEPPLTERLPDSSCNMKCPVDPHLACGGYFTVNIYQTGIRPTPHKPLNLLPTSEEPVRIVFLLTLNGRALRQVHRLLKILYKKQHYYYIHVDIRQDYLFRELTRLEKQYPNIRLTRNRFATIWGGASLLSMLLSTMKELLQLDWQWDYVLNLSESDYPVKTVTKLEQFLSSNRNRNFVKSHGQDVQRFIQKQGLDKTFVECETRMWRIADRKLPWGVQIDGGSDWIALSRPFVEYVTDDDESDVLVKGLKTVFTYTLLPAESFFHTVLRNSRFCESYVDNNLHVTNWKRKLGCKCQYRHVVDWCGCSPNDFKPEDWIKIQSTQNRQLFFARKFEPIVNQEVILHLERWLYGQNFREGLINLDSYWQSVYNHLDLGDKDDNLLTFMSSALRIHSSLFPYVCNLQAIKVLELTTFNRKDTYQKTLLSYEANYTENNIKTTIEFGMKPINTINYIKLTEIAHRIEYLKISTDYDQKEQLLRNFAQIMGPYSEPALAYNFTEAPTDADNYNVTFLWIDPWGRLADVSFVLVEPTSTVGHEKLSSNQPHLPGEWTVKMVHDEELIAETNFLILPLEYYGGKLAVESQLGLINGGAEPYLDVTPWRKFLIDSNENQVSNKSGLQLQKWIDSLVGRFYEMQSSCVVEDIRNLCGVELMRCIDTDWSSFAPDPKSRMEGYFEDFE